MKKMRTANGALALFGLNEIVLRVFSMSGFESLFFIFNSEEEALNSVGDQLKG